MFEKVKFNCELINTYLKNSWKQYFRQMIRTCWKKIEFTVIIINTYSKNLEIFKLFLVFRVNFDSDPNPNPNLFGFGSGSERSRIRIRIGLKNRIRIRIRKKSFGSPTLHVILFIESFKTKNMSKLKEKYCW